MQHFQAAHWKCPQDNIDWKSLPKQFVVKTTHGGGGLNVIVCFDKSKLDERQIRQRLAYKATPVKANTLGREWAYYGLQPGIVVEELLVNQENPAAGINDYKFFCFNGEPKYIVVDVDRYIGHKRNFYDLDWHNLNITSDCPASDREISSPPNVNRMIEIAKKLSEGFPFVRVDLYNVEGKVYFGEMTFYPWSGYVRFIPDEWDYIFSEDFILKKEE